MRYLGDFPVDGIVYFDFNTQQADGTPITLADAAVVVRKNDTAAPLALEPAPVLTVDLNGVTGLHNVKVDLADSDFIAGDYDVCLSAGTVDGVSVAGRVLAHFSIENRTAPPTVEQIQSGLALAGEAASALAAYDPPTRAEATADKDAVIVAVEAIPTAIPPAPTPLQIRTEMEGVGTKLTLIKDKTDMLPAAPAGVGDAMMVGGYLPGASPEDALTAYDPPTKAELDEAVAGIPAAPTADAITDAILDEATAGHAGAGTVGKAIADAAAGTDTSALATSAEVAAAQVAIIAAIPGAPTNYAITDTVTDNLGNPLAGAEIRVFGDVNCTGPLLDTATSNDQGQFTCYANAPGTYYLRISINGYTTSTAQKVVS